MFQNKVEWGLPTAIRECVNRDEGGQEGRREGWMEGVLY